MLEKRCLQLFFWNFGFLGLLEADFKVLDMDGMMETAVKKFIDNLDVVNGKVVSRGEKQVAILIDNVGEASKVLKDAINNVINGKDGEVFRKLLSDNNINLDSFKDNMVKIMRE